MGTNYYRVNIPTEDDIKRMHELIDAHKFESRRGYWDNETESIIPEDAITCVQDPIEKCTKKIHICKMSFGWKTCFDHNWGKYYQPNRASLEVFLSEPNTVIKDEYGDIISFEEFWKEVDTRDNIVNEEGLKPFTSKTYMEFERSQGKQNEWICRDEISKCKSIFGINTDSNDFDVDGLRFAVYSDFS